MAACLVLAGLTGVGCGVGGGEQGEDVGRIQLALQMAPADGLCLRLTVDQPSTTLKVVKMIGLTPNQASQTQVLGLPVGSVGLTGEVFNVACGSVVAASVLTWVSDRLPVTIAPDLTQTVTLTLRRAAKVNLGVDFVANPAIEEIKLAAAPIKIAAAPDGTMVLTMASSNAFWRVSTAFNLKLVTTLPAAGSSQPRLITTAPDGSVLVTSNSDQTLFILSGAGALKSTLSMPPLTVGDMVVDPAGVGWVGATNSSVIVRLTNIQGTMPVSAAPVTMPTTTTAALALGSDGLVRVGGAGGGAVGSIYSITSTGSVVGSTQRPLQVIPRDLVVTSDNTMWAMAQVAGNNLFKVPVTANTTAVLSMATAPTEVAIVNTSKGVVVADSGGNLVLIKPDGVLQVIPLPGNAVATSLAVSAADGRVWAGVPANPRLLVVTLP
jgi:streptogramin lyase